MSDIGESADRSQSEGIDGRNLPTIPVLKTIVLFFGFLLSASLQGANKDSAPASPADLRCEACQHALSPEMPGSSDNEIALLQKKIKTVRNPNPLLDRLGWLYVTKARVSHDPGYYKLAEESARCLEILAPGSQEALLLRGHVLHSLHRFSEAEPVARQLTEQRGAPFDFGLLGDVLFDQGRVDEAVKAYQKMVDLKPDLHSYSRAAQARWIKGDVEGAIELLGMAAKASSSQVPEPGAWVYSRLALYQFQTGESREALQSVAQALELIPEYAPALLVRGRILLSQNDVAGAVKALSRAAELNPLPDYQWPLADALRSLGKENEAGKIEALLEKRGRGADPRSFSLYLATRRQNPTLAILLAREELKSRTDVFTHDALAWALQAAGQTAEARTQMQMALAEGTRDPRMFYHAAVIARAAGDLDQARRFLSDATPEENLLFPSERKDLASLAKQISQTSLTQQNK